MADLAPRRGLYLGTCGLVGSVAFICGPSLGLTLFSANPLALWAACGLLGLLSAAMILRAPKPGPRAAPLPAPALPKANAR